MDDRESQAKKASTVLSITTVRLAPTLGKYGGIVLLLSVYGWATHTRLHLTAHDDLVGREMDAIQYRVIDVISHSESAGRE